MGMTKQQTIDYAVMEVLELNRIFDGLQLNGVICLPKKRPYAIKDCFLARAKELIFDATREQLEAAYDELDEAGVAEVTVEEIFKLIGNRAPNPDNEDLIHTVHFGPV